MRDFQKSKVYQAENNALMQLKENPEFTTLDECKTYINEIINSDYWNKHKGWKRIKLRCGRGCTNAFYRAHDKSITLPKWARGKMVIIHECAHWLTRKTTEDGTSHGSHFAGHFLMLIDELLGEEHSAALMQQYEELGVIYHLM